MTQSSTMTPIAPAFPIGKSNPPPPIFEPSTNQTSTVGNIPEDRDDSDITLARKTYSLQDHDGIGSHIYWSTEPVEWSPIGEETGNSMPATASEYLSSKPTPPEISPNMSSSLLKPTLDKETRSVEKVPDSRLKKLLPILVVILLLIGLIAALLSSFFLPASPSSGNTSKDLRVVEVRSMPIDKEPT